MRPEQAYHKLLALAREETVLASCSDLLEWDEETFMPRGGVENRAEQMALLAGILHDRGADPAFDDLLGLIEGSALVADPESPEAVNVRELRREYERERRLPRGLVEEGARVATLSAQAWYEAREARDFTRFASWLERVVVLAREEADAVGYPDCRYDALLEDYEPGTTTRQVRALLDGLKAQLVPLVAELATPAAVPAHVLRREFPVDRQELFGRAVASALGFDLERGRIDVAHHPFCTALGPGDVRIAVRWHRRHFALGFFTLLHEVGHGLYDQGLESAHYGTPMGEAPSLGLHESQSRLWENLVGRSLGFWRHYYPRLRSVFSEALHDISLDTFRQVINRVAPGPDRGKADEVTYNLHIVIRFELEVALVEGDLAVPDLPHAWSDAYRRYLGVTPRNDAEGCLQDGHWSEGMLGYFPTYALGNVYAAQLYQRAEHDLGDLDEAFAAGDFGGLLGWLRDRVFRQGQRWSTPALIERVTGAPPSPGALLESLRRRYGPTSPSR
jgi:carboxypeptidase Taq